MKRRSVFFKKVLLLLLLIFVGCSEERKDDYKGVSELISDRSQARSLIRKQPGGGKADQDKPVAEGQKSSQQNKTDPEQEEISPVILYEEKVKIYSDSSDKILAKGIAYMNKQGRIVRLKIVND